MQCGQEVKMRKEAKAITESRKKLRPPKAKKGVAKKELSPCKHGLYMCDICHFGKEPFF